MVYLEFPALCADREGAYRHVIRLEDIKEIVESADGTTALKLVERSHPILINQPFEDVMGRIRGVFQELAQRQGQQPQGPSILVPTLRNGR